MGLYIVEDENYRLVVKANNWNEAKEKANGWFHSKFGKPLDIKQLQVNICDNDEVIE